MRSDLCGKKYALFDPDLSEVLSGRDLAVKRWLIPFALGLFLAGCAGGVSKKEYVLYNNLGVRCARQGLWKEAMVWLERARDLKPDCASVLNNLGVCYEYLGRDEDARKAYEGAVALDDRSEYRENLECFKKRFEED